MTPLLAQRPRVDRSFERLYRRHVADVYHYALAVLRNPSDAEDVTQTTFLNAYRAYQRGERPVAAQNWLIAIAHNVCRQRFRQSSRRPQEVAFDEDVADAIVDDAAPSAHDIRQALGHLAFNQRAALVMRELEGRTYSEIGEILDLSVSAVETLIFRARRALREQLEGSLTCGEAELAISRQVDRRLPRAERGPLRAHLRQCPECATFARSQRAQRAAFKTLGAVPLPASLSSLFGGGGATVGSAVAAKAAAVLAAGALVGGVGYEGATHSSLLGSGSSSARRAAPAPAEKASAAHGSAAPTPIQEVVRNVVVAEKARPEEAGPKGKKSASPASARGKSASKGHGAGAATANGRGNAAHSGASVGASRSSTRAAPTRTRASGAGANGRRVHGAPAAGTSRRGSKGTTTRKASPKAHPAPRGQAGKAKSPKADSQAATSAPAADRAKKSK